MTTPNNGHAPDWQWTGYRPRVLAAGRRLGLGEVLAAGACASDEIRALGRRLGGQADWLRAIRAEGRGLRPAEREQVQSTMIGLEGIAQSYHALAAAAEAMIGDAYRAFGLDVPARPYRVECDHDEGTP